MVRNTMRAMLVPMVLGCLLSAVPSSTARAAHPDIFYNYYNGPTVYGSGAPVQLYVAPRPTPAYVGHTWNTYPPLMPHEFLYCHKRCYFKYYRNGGFTSSHVCWSSCKCPSIFW